MRFHDVSGRFKTLEGFRSEGASQDLKLISRDFRRYSEAFQSVSWAFRVDLDVKTFH